MIKIIVANTWAEGKGFNTLVLKSNNWDDYGYKTTYDIRFYDSRATAVWCSSLQIYCRKMDEGFSSKNIWDYLPRQIEKLDDSFCSLGQDINFYVGIKKYISNEYSDVLYRLNDLAYDNKRWNKFKDFEGVRRSLLRSSSAAKARSEAYAQIEGNGITHGALSFSYKAVIPYCDSRVQFSFSFDKESELPYRINALVGKNGTGKTSLLKCLAEDLSGFKQLEIDNSMFTGERRPSFDKVISVSYSAFDPFNKIKNKKSLHSYVYCGIQTEQGILLNSDEVRRTFSSSMKMIKEKERMDQWKSIISEVFIDNRYDISAELDDYIGGKVNWSSGQSILISSMTEVIARIDRESIILFDEPELHLHPNAMANVMRMLNRILEEFNSYAIIATHSPIILQEIPSKNISILYRYDNQLIVKRPTIECFGENLSVISRAIFSVERNESFYQSYFEVLKKKGKTREEIEELFDNRLGMNALVYLDILFSQGSKG